jgi:hypothetical protein
MAINGFVDPSFGTNILRGGDVKYLNQAFGVDGSANDNGHPTVLPSAGTWEFKCTYFYNLAQKGVKVARVEGHDPQAEQVLIAAGKEKAAEDILETLDAANIYGIKVIVTLGGMSDPNTAPQAYGLYDTTTNDYRRFVELAAFVADAVSGHPALIVLELLNEPDYMTAIKGYWLPRYPGGRMALLNAFAIWQDGMISAVKGKQLKPRTPLGMGTAMDSSLYCDANGVPAMPWGTEECIATIMPRMAAGCDVWTPHLYQHERTALALQVLKNDKLTSFIKAAQRANKPLVLGEVGGLYAGGVWTPELQAVYDQYPDLVVCWMIRSWDPKVYTVPAIPPRHPVAVEIPTPPPVETPVTPTAPPSTDSSSPAEEPAEPPQEPVADPEPIPDPEAPKPPAGVPPAEPVEEDPVVIELPPSSEPKPRRGQGFAIVQVLEMFFKLIKNMKWR